MIVCSNYLISEDAKISIVTDELIMDDKGNELEIKNYPDVILIGINGDVHKLNKCYIEYKRFEDGFIYKALCDKDETFRGMQGGGGVVFIGTL